MYLFNELQKKYLNTLHNLLKVHSHAAINISYTAGFGII